jgi:hypothetical protein
MSNLRPFDEAPAVGPVAKIRLTTVEAYDAPGWTAKAFERTAHPDAGRRVNDECSTLL